MFYNLQALIHPNSIKFLFCVIFFVYMQDLCLSKQLAALNTLDIYKNAIHATRMIDPLLSVQCN